MRLVWLTALESSEPVGIPVDRIALVEQKTPTEGHAVAIHLDIGKEIRVMESLTAIRAMLESMDADKDRADENNFT